MIIKNHDEVKHWLKKRNINKLRIISNPKLRTIGFADILKSEYIISDLSILHTPSIRNIYNRVKSKVFNDSQMIKDWLVIISH